MVNDKIVSDIQNLVEVLFIGTVFVRVLLVGMAFAESRISSHAITKFSVILPTYVPFSQLHVKGLQK